MAVSVETKQVRHSHRIEISMPAAIAREDGRLFPCTLRDYSDAGVGLEMLQPDLVKKGERLVLILKRGTQEFAFPCEVMRAFNNTVGIQLHLETTQQHIDFMQCTFARADTWALWQNSVPEDKPMSSMRDVLMLGLRGYQKMLEYSPPFLYSILGRMATVIVWLTSFLPQRVRQPKEAAPI